MYDRTGNYLIVAILIGMILGVVVVAIFGEAVLPVKFLGDIFLNALKMVVIPLLFCSMIVGITKLGDVRKLGRTGLKTLLYFVVTSSIAVAIGLILVNVFQPGAGFGTFETSLPEVVQSRESYSFFAWLTDQIPSNIIAAAAETKVLPIIVFALFFGGVLTTIGSRGKPVIAFFEGLNDAIMKIVHLIMWFAPIGIFGLVAGQLAAQGGMSGFTGVLSALGKYSLVVILGLLIHGVVVLPLILKFIGGKNPIEYFVGMSQALMTAFATASSSATLPVSMECVEEKNDIDKRASSFVLPLGATINMDGTALYEAVAAMFIAQAYGIALPIWSQITIFATAVLASVGAAGIPQAGLVTMILVLQAVGLPLEGIGLILAIDWFLDRCRTTVNVWGDSIGAAVIATTAEIGLVDRRQMRTVKSGRTRIRSLGRRKDPRMKSASQEPRQPAKKERIWAKRKKTGGPFKESARQSSRPGRKPDRGRNGRFSRRDTRNGGYGKGDRRQESGPREKADAPKTFKSDTVKPDQGTKPESPSKLQQDQGKPAYGRKRSRPPHARAKSKSDHDRREKQEIAAEEKPVVKSGTEETNKDYEVPKFPETILDDLVPKDEDRAASKQEDAVEKSSAMAESPPEDNDPALTAGQKSPAESAEFSEEKVETGDFSQLDRAVLGAADQTGDNQVSETTDKSVKPSHESQAEFGEESGADEKQETIDSDVPVYAANVPDDAEKADDEGNDVSPVAEADVSKAETENVVEVTTSTPDSQSEEKPSESTDETTDEEISEKDESDDDSMKWGRHKQKKMSR